LKYHLYKITCEISKNKWKIENKHAMPVSPHCLRKNGDIARVTIKKNVFKNAERFTSLFSSQIGLKNWYNMYPGTDRETIKNN
jgi:hypothetical protein